MADKRMFNKKITTSDAFRDMPVSAQNLYFHLNMEADDDGFVNKPRQIMQAVKASEDDLKLLIVKRFIIGFDSGIIVIKHWRMHNTLRKDRYHPTDYQEELRMLGIKDNGTYSEIPITLPESVATKWQPNGNQMATEIRLDKISIHQQEQDIYNNARENLIDSFTNELCRPITPIEMELLQQWEKDYSLDLVKLALKEAVVNNKRSFKYIEAILVSWKGKGIRTAIEAQQEIEQFNNRKSSANLDELEDIKKQYCIMRNSAETIDTASQLRMRYYNLTGRDIEEDVQDD